MKKLTLILICLLAVSQATLLGQNNKNEPDTSLIHRGFDFVIAGGAYFGNKYSANYYNGSPQNENSLNYLFDNKYYYDQINELVKSNHHYISDSVFLGELPQDMRYNPAMAISFGFKYKLNKNWGISLYYSFAKVTATDLFLLTYKGETGNYHDGYIEAHLVGKEARSMFDLSVSYIFHPSKIVKPFIDFGLQFNYVKVQRFFALIEDQEFELLDYYNGANYVPGVDMQKYNVIFGGAGYGISASAGIKLAFNRYISIDPTFYLSASSFGLTGYKDIRLNYGAFIRVTMSDLVFMK
ncbi:hypothetical protein LJC68_04690 [Bacteroidales bacterium OttesenSCG-928-B11]|nr:hypothetical protein [Bacteroidales bacterium OttesenSCG-928-E04]MDL2308759.1 hypothetical protein [Bacteroidales bacterium OttesenSCG-928-C03]MDL2312156.1 hypothetical protein [Bacteroidales bacterium OttesenSCG-928-B11]